MSWLVARRTQPIAVAPVVAANLGVHDAPVIPCAVDLDLFAPVDRSRGQAQPGLARSRAVRAVSRRPQRPLEGPQQARRRLRRDDRPAAREAPGVFAASLDGLPRERGRAGDERRRRRGDHLAVGGRAGGRQGVAGVRDAGRVGRGRGRLRRGRRPPGMRDRPARPGGSGASRRQGAARGARSRGCANPCRSTDVSRSPNACFGVYRRVLAGRSRAMTGTRPAEGRCSSVRTSRRAAPSGSGRSWSPAWPSGAST